jgi:glutaredoxin 3
VANGTPTITMYTTAMCPFCVRAERYLGAKGVTSIAKIRVDLDPGERVEMMKKTGRRTVPQIYVGDVHVGGYEDLVALDQAGRLVRFSPAPIPSNRWSPPVKARKIAGLPFF